jgi:hypothetical protein
MSSDNNTEYKSAAEIEKEVDAARREVTETVEAIEDKLSPGQLIDKVLPLFRQSGASATMAHYGKSLTHSAQANPVPFLLVGAGLAWMALSSSQTSRPRVSSHAPSYDGPAGASAGGEESDHGRAHHAMDSVRDNMAGAADSARHLLHDLNDKAHSAYDKAADGASRAASDAASSARRYASQGRDLALEHPLILGLAGFTLGAAIGAAFPASDLENEVAGKYSDKVKKDVETAAREQVDRAGDIVSAAATAARDAAKDAGLTMSQGAESAGALVDKLERVGEAALTAATEEAGTVEGTTDRPADDQENRLAGPSVSS